MQVSPIAATPALAPAPSPDPNSFGAQSSGLMDTIGSAMSSQSDALGDASGDSPEDLAAMQQGMDALTTLRDAVLDTIRLAAGSDAEGPSASSAASAPSAMQPAGAPTPDQVARTYEAGRSTDAA